MSINILEEITMSAVLQLGLARASREWFSDPDFASSAEAFVRSLTEQGYALQTVHIYMEGVAHFAHWCTRRSIGLKDIDDTTVACFLDRHLPVCRCAPRCQRTRNNMGAALTHWLDLLRTEGRMAPRRSADPVRIAEEIHSYRHYLIEVRGLRISTCAARLRDARAFLLDRFGVRRIRINALTPVVVNRFFRKYTRGLASSSKKDVCNSLRSYFRFRAVLGDNTAGLVAAVPHVAQWRLARLPKGLSTDQISRLLRAFDRSSSTGRRDYAITRCCVDLGLRTSEVTRLSLEDIDWSRGLLYIRGKGSRVDLLPLPQFTARAIVEYLRRDRPRTRSRALFLRHRPPLGSAATPSVIRQAVRRAASRCGVDACLNGPHVLRHALAERLVQRGTPLKQIADLLRHRSLDTTTIYAKVDLPALTKIALPWPGVRS